MSNPSETCNATCEHSPPEVPSYGDIGGIGVTLAFVITAWTVVIVLVGYYLKVFDPKLDPFRKEGTQKPTECPNSIDYTVHGILQSLPWLKNDSESISSRSSRLGTVLNSCVLMFADVQIFTSLAILIGAYASVGCDIVAYHWQYMVYLAWLASITHMASLSFLRNHLANNPAKCAWRLVAMCTIQVMLSVAVGLSMTFDGDPWLDSQGGRPAVCYFQEQVKTSSVTFQSAIKFIVLLVWGFAIRIAKTFENFEGGLRRTASRLEQRGNRHRKDDSGTTVRDWDHKFADASLPRRIWGYFSVPMLIGFYSVLSIQLDLFTSLLAEVYWLFFSILWITARLLKLRITGNQDDSEWTFGQVLPIILLVAPPALAIEAFYTVPTSNEPASDPQEIPVLNSDDTRDLSHIHSSVYRGVFFLAVLSYIEIAIYFVLDKSEAQGLAAPLTVISLSVFIFQPVLQLSWVVCNLWIDKMTWDMPLKRTIHDVVLLVYSAIALSENFIPGDVFSVFLAFLLILLTHASLTATFVLVAMLRETNWRFPLYVVLLCASYLAIRTIITGIISGSFGSFRSDMFLLIFTAVLMPLELFVFSLEVWAEKKHLSKRMAFLVRSACLICLSPLCLVSSLFISYTYISLFLGGFLFSLQIWSVIGLCIDDCRRSFDSALGSAV